MRLHLIGSPAIISFSRMQDYKSNKKRVSLVRLEMNIPLILTLAQSYLYLSKKNGTKVSP